MPASQSVDGAEKSQCVLVFLPGSMQTIFDQSLGVIAQQVGAACNRVMKTTAYTSSPVEEINVTSKEKIQKCSIKHVDGCRKKIVVISANYVPILSKTLDSSSYVLRFLRLFGFVCGSIPLLARILKKKQQRGHSNLTRGNKVLVILTCSIVIITLFAASITVAGLIKDLMKDLSLPFIPAALQGVVEPIKYIILGATLFSVCIVGFVPPTVMSAVLASGGEYYGLVRYVLKSDRSDEIQTYLNQVYTHITENYPSVPIHLLCFSFGCIVGFDYLFRCTGKERFNTQLIKSVCFIGFPYAIFNAGAPKYFANRQWPEDGIMRWLNLYLADDVLGSKITRYLHQIFPSYNETRCIPLEDLKVEPQRSAETRWSNPIARHMTYWDPGATQSCEAIEKAVGSFLELDA